LKIYRNGWSRRLSRSRGRADHRAQYCSNGKGYPAGADRCGRQLQDREGVYGYGQGKGHGAQGADGREPGQLMIKIVKDELAALMGRRKRTECQGQSGGDTDRGAPG